jgi:hypothetical protein
VYVTSGATLTIQPGTIIKGDKTTKGTLVIERGGKINAIGTAAKPIVFTSNQPKGQRTYGDWGGVVICGKAKINNSAGEATIEGGLRSKYGGTDDNDNSGTLKYVRIEFPGIPFVQDQEINGLTMGGVGKGTTIEYIQVSYCGDDSYEWFGGNVNCKYLIAHRGWDDEFDTDLGFSGKVQFAIAVRDAAQADVSGSNGFESDNDGTGSTLTPQTKPIFSNVTIIGPKFTTATTVHSNYKRSMHIRRNSSLCVYNSVFSGYPTGLILDGGATQGNATAGSLQIKNTILAGMGSFFAAQFDRDYFFGSGLGNDTLATNDLLGLTNAFSLTNPKFIPSTSSPLRNKASFTGDNISDPFFTQVTFIGAMGDTDWTAGWANWDPNNTEY